METDIATAKEGEVLKNIRDVFQPYEPLRWFDVDGQVLYRVPHRDEMEGIICLYGRLRISGMELHQLQVRPNDRVLREWIKQHVEILADDLYKSIQQMLHPMNRQALKDSVGPIPRWMVDYVEEGCQRIEGQMNVIERMVEYLDDRTQTNPETGQL